MNEWIKPVHSRIDKSNFLPIGLAVLTSLALAFIPWLGLLNYPFRLLLTMVHELGHGLAALLTGGRFIRFVVFADGSGLAYTAGGWRWVVIPAGYLGTALFAAGLILLGRNERHSRLALGALGAVMALFAVRYTVPGIFSPDIVGSLLTLIMGVLFGLLFVSVAWRARAGWVIYLTYLLAIQAVLTAFSDLLSLVGMSARFFHAPANDAASMAELTYIPAVVWAVLWAVIAVGLIAAAIWRSWGKTVKG